MASRRTRKRRARISVGKAGGSAARRRAKRLAAEMMRRDPAIRRVSLSIGSPRGNREAERYRRVKRRPARPARSHTPKRKRRKGMF